MRRLFLDERFLLLAADGLCGAEVSKLLNTNDIVGSQIIRKLESQGVVTSLIQGRRRVFTITAKGVRIRSLLQSLVAAGWLY